MKQFKVSRQALRVLLSSAALILGALSTISDVPSRDRDEVRLTVSARLHPVYELEAFGATTIVDELRVE